MHGQPDPRDAAVDLSDSRVATACAEFVEHLRATLVRQLRGKLKILWITIPEACCRVEFGMTDNARMILIALGVALIVVILVPTLFMGGMMAAMMSGDMMGSGAWVVLGLALLIVVAGGVVLLASLRR
jgi:hypothetical protein